MKILITGTTGFIGGHLLRYFAKQSHDMIAWSRSEKAPIGLEEFAKYTSVDLLEQVPKLKVDVCIHCAGYANDVGDWNTFYRNNVQTTINLFEAIDSPRWINVSSSSVYPLLSNAITESDVDEENFSSFYGKSKYEAEQWMKKQMSSNQTVISLRPRGVYGTNDRVLLPRILKQGKKGVVKLPGGGNVKLSMTHISNFVQAVDLAIHSKQTGFNVYNVADEDNYILRDVFQKVNEGFLGRTVEVKNVSTNLVRTLIKISSLFGKPFPLTMQAFDYITTPSIINIGKIKKDLGYQPTTNFHNELKGITDWARSVPVEKLFAAHRDLAWDGI
jgi:nucleoside-diphosphate-sugar epimerase